MLINNHSYSLKGLEEGNQIYTNRVTSGSELNCSFQDNLSVIIESDNTVTIGWALPKRRFSRFNYCQQKYIYDLYIGGETTGKKVALEKLALEMENLRTDGEKCF